MEIRKEKKKLADLLTDFHLRLQLELGKSIGIFELADMVGVSGPQMSRWMTTTQNSMPGGGSAIQLVNFYLEYFGEEALYIYDYLGWDRPKSFHAIAKTSSSEKDG